MDKKYENGMSLEQLIGEMLKDAKVVKIPIQPKQNAEQEAQKSDKSLAAHPAGVPTISLNIENLHIEAKGLDIVAHVHDEVIIEAPKDKYTVDEICQLMAANPDWCDGLPLAAAGYKGNYYFKD